MTSLHLWRIDLDAPTPPDSDLDGLLDQTEQRRAAALAEGLPRSRFLRAHGALRLILAGRLGCFPEAIPIGTDEPDGKPRIDRLWLKRRRLDFSLAHSAGQALLGLAEGGARVGVDIEARGTPADFRALAERLFTPEELRWLWREPPARQGFRFLQCWTRKEAYLKAIGKGLSRAPDGFRCRLDADGKVVGLAYDAAGRPLTEWHCVALDEPPYAACAVIDVSPAETRIETFEWTSARRTG